MNNEKRVRASEVVGSLEVFPLEDGAEVVEGFLLLKVRDSAGEITWSMRKSEGLPLEELLGSLVMQCRLAERSLLSEWEVD